MEIMDNYLTVRSVGFITYCEALIARIVNGEFHAFFFSIIGSPSYVKASTAGLFTGDFCRITQNDEPAMQLKFHDTIQTYRNRKIGNTVNKIVISKRYFIDKTQTAVVYGPDLFLVQERAFLTLDAATSVPLKPEWQEWLWDEILQPEKLYSFGSENMKEAYCITWPDDTTLEEKVLEGVKLNYLT